MNKFIKNFKIAAMVFAILLFLLSIACTRYDDTYVPYYTYNTINTYDTIQYGNATQIPVLTYHSVMPHEYYYPINVANSMILPLETFYEQMRYLSDNGFNSVTAEQLIDFLFYDGRLPQNPVIITFDDGYLDNYLFAAPVLRQFGFTAMQFLITTYIIESTPTMKAHPIQFMSMAQVMNSADVFEFGSHTHNMHHFINGIPALTIASSDSIRADLRQSFEAPLTFRTGFAYPYGQYSDSALTVLAEEGVRFAFTTYPGYVDRDSHPLLLPRFTIAPNITHEMFSDIVWGR